MFSASSTEQSPFLVCLPKMLPRYKWLNSARIARHVNPMNHAPVERLTGLIRGFAPTPKHLAVVVTRYWGSAGVRLTVGFLDSPPTDLRKHLLEHMNAWGKTANVTFVWSSSGSQVRIARQGGPSGGYWSYVGTDILSIDANLPTMNLEAFTMRTPEAEFHRVVRHETGHTLGFPHEHMRRALVKLIDRKKAIAYFKKTQDWSPRETQQQVLTPIEESSLRGTPEADPNSIMCYQIPSEITINGQPIVGGLDIDASDYDFAGSIYPRSVSATSSVGKDAAKQHRKGRRGKV